MSFYGKMVSGNSGVNLHSTYGGKITFMPSFVFIIYIVYNVLLHNVVLL